MAFYAVRIGRKPGIYNTWSECKAQTNGFTGAIFRKFESEHEARLFVMGKKTNAVTFQYTRPTGISSGNNIENHSSASAEANETDTKNGLNSNIKYRFVVKEYMTRPASATFEFMRKWNNNVPMPSTVMSGFKIRETKGMVYVSVRTDSTPSVEWKGWIIKSAILSETEISLFSASGNSMQNSGRSMDVKRLTITVLIYRNNRNSFSMRVSLNKKDTYIIDQLTNRFHAKETSTELEYLVFIDLLEDILEFFKNYRVIVQNPEGYDADKDHEIEAEELISDYPEIEWKTKPYNHQTVAYTFGMQHSKMLIADAQGLGKSIEAIMIASGKKKQFGYKHCLVICGVNTLKWNWVKEITMHSDEKCRILGMKRKNVGDMKAKIKDLDNLDTLDAYFLITNIETLRNKNFFAKLQNLCKQGEISMVIVDEFHKAKNTSSQQGQNLMKLDAECKIILTGTPVLNSPLDLYGYFKWLGYEKHSQSSFEHYYCYKVQKYDKPSYRHMDVMRKNLDKIMLRRLKEEVLDLPEKLFDDQIIEMDTDQQRMYDKVRDELIQQLGEISFSDNPLAKMTRLRQVTGHPGILDSTMTSSAKIERLKDMVEEYAENNQKVIIFSNWTSVLDRARDALAVYNPLMITGETKSSERLALVDQFQTDPESLVIMGTVGAMGTGLTMTAAEAVIFIDEPWTYAVKDQCIDRAHRIGTTHTVTVHTLICKDSIDEKVHLIVQSKRDMSDYLVDNKMDNASMVKFLLGL